MTSREIARYAGCTIDLNGSGAVEEYVQFPPDSSQALTTGKMRRTATKAMKSATPAVDSTPPIRTVESAFIFNRREDYPWQSSQLRGIKRDEPVRAVLSDFFKVRIEIKKRLVVIDVLVPKIVDIAKILLLGLSLDPQHFVCENVRDPRAVLLHE
jgi:hypothetical protein